MKRLVLTILLVAALLAGCGGKATPAAPTAEPTATFFYQPPTAIPPTPTDTLVPTATLEPTPLPSPTPAPTEPPTPMPTPARLPAIISADGLNLRDGPSALFTYLGRYPKNTKITVVGRVAGDEWVHVVTPDGRNGWFMASYLTLEGPITAVPLEPFTAAYLITGRVADSSGTPVNALTLAVTQTRAGKQARIDVATGADGLFYAYLPLSSEGVWDVSVVGVGCTSWITDGNCAYRGLFDPASIPVTLPPSGPIAFTYR
jgi:uncharacterized protein YraI